MVRRRARMVVAAVVVACYLATFFYLFPFSVSVDYGILSGHNNPREATVDAKKMLYEHDVVSHPYSQLHLVFYVDNGFKIHNWSSPELTVTENIKNERVDICKAWLSGLILNYPAITVVSSSETTGTSDSILLANLQAIYNHLSSLRGISNSDLVFVANDPRVLFQLPPEILVSRFRTVDVDMIFGKSPDDDLIVDSSVIFGRLDRMKAEYRIAIDRVSFLNGVQGSGDLYSIFNVVSYRYAIKRLDLFSCFFYSRSNVDFRGPVAPDILLARPPFPVTDNSSTSRMRSSLLSENDAEDLLANVPWASLLLGHADTGVVPILLTSNATSLYTSMWYHQYARKLLKAQLRRPQPFIYGSSEDHLWNGCGGRGGLWISDGRCISWEEGCSGLEDAIFGDEQGIYGKEGGEDGSVTKNVFGKVITGEKGD